MPTVTEKNTEKNNILALSNDHDKIEKHLKKQYKKPMSLPPDDLSPELLDAHIVALLRNALS